MVGVLGSSPSVDTEEIPKMPRHLGNFLFLTLLEIEGEDNHLGSTTIHAAGEFEEGFIGEIGAVMVDDVTESEAELKFWNELEIRKIEVTASTDFHVTVKGMREEGIVLAHGEVYRRCQVGDDVWTEVVVTRSRDFQAYGHRDAGGFDALCAVTSSGLFVEPDALLPKVNSGLNAQAEGGVQAYFSEYTHSKARHVTIHVCVPLLSCGGVDVTVVLELDIHHVHADEETIMQEALIQIGSVHDDWFLSTGGQEGT